MTRTWGGRWSRPAFARRHTQREGMNGTEARYAAHLDQLIQAGAVQWWAFESVKVLIGGGSFYRPDFIVQLADGMLELHEVKGFMTEAARLRIKVAASRYPFVFKVVRAVPKKRQAQAGEWEVEVIGDTEVHSEDVEA